MIADYYVIKAARFELGWTQDDLAREANVCVNTIRNLERGKDISPVTNGKVRKALGLERRLH